MRKMGFKEMFKDGYLVTMMAIVAVCGAILTAATIYMTEYGSEWVIFLGQKYSFLAVLIFILSFVIAGIFIFAAVSELLSMVEHGNVAFLPLAATLIVLVVLTTETTKMAAKSMFDKKFAETECVQENIVKGDKVCEKFSPVKVTVNTDIDLDEWDCDTDLGSCFTKESRKAVITVEKCETPLKRLKYCAIPVRFKNKKTEIVKTEVINVPIRIKKDTVVSSVEY